MSASACTSVSKPAGSSGAYIHVTDTGSDIASISELTCIRRMLVQATTPPMTATAIWLLTSNPRHAVGGSMS